MSRENEGDLALAVRANMDGSMERLVRAYQDQIYSYVLRMLRNRFDAQEVTQDAFIRAYRALTSRYDDERCRNLALRPWLFQIARNLTQNRLRARRAALETPLHADDQLVGRKTSAQGLASEYPAGSGLVEQALDLLKPGARELIVLRFVRELPYAEMAKILGTSEASARGKVFRALRQLKPLLLRK